MPPAYAASAQVAAPDASSALHSSRACAALGAKITAAAKASPPTKTGIRPETVVITINLRPSNPKTPREAVRRMTAPRAWRGAAPGSRAGRMEDPGATPDRKFTASDQKLIVTPKPAP